MQANRYFLKATATALLTFAAGMAAADTQPLSVTASVMGVCKFNTGQSPVLAFGAINPSGTLDATGSATVKYRCTNGTAATITSAGVTGARTMAGAVAGNTLAYSLAFTSGATGTGTGFGAGGTDLSLVLGGTITAAQYNTAKADSYSETVTLTVTP